MTHAAGQLLVLGAGGRLGRLLRACWPDQDDVIWHSRRGGADLCFDPLTDGAALTEAARGARAILCLSGVTHWRAAQTGVSLSLNTDLALAAIDGAAQAGVGRVFLASSAAVYGRATGSLDEAGECDPVSDYGLAKLSMERAAQARGQSRGVAVCSLRIGNVAGADAILDGWRVGFVLDQFADGSTPRRSYIGPRSLSRVLDALSRKAALPECINVAAPGAVALGALLDAADLEWKPRPAEAGSIASVELSTSRLDRLTRLGHASIGAANLVREWRASCPGSETAQ